MSAPKVIWAYDDGLWIEAWDAPPSGSPYIRADAPELVALVGAAKDALTVLEEYNMGSESPVIFDLVAALAALKGDTHE